MPEALLIDPGGAYCRESHIPPSAVAARRYRPVILVDVRESPATTPSTSVLM